MYKYFHHIHNIPIFQLQLLTLHQFRTENDCKRGLEHYALIKTRTYQCRLSDQCKHGMKHLLSVKAHSQRR